MGIYDRDYYRNTPARPAFNGRLAAWSVNTWLIVTNVAVFFLNSLLMTSGGVAHVVVGYDPFGQPLFTEVARPPVHPIDAFGYFSVVTAVLHLQLWRFLTFQFLHANFNHILANMFSLFFFGPLIESYLGRRRYLAFYLLCGVAGPVMYMLMWALHLLHDGPATPLVGASAGIFGVLVAAAMVAPNAEVLVWGILPIRMRTLAWGLLALAAYTVFAYGPIGTNNAGGQAAHLGGAAAGYLLIRYRHVLDGVGPRRTKGMRYRP